MPALRTAPAAIRVILATLAVLLVAYAAELAFHYRKAMSAEVAVEELERCAGAQFDLRVVGAFRELADRRDGSTVTHS